MKEISRLLAHLCSELHLMKDDNYSLTGKNITSISQHECFDHSKDLQ